jgi:hypothetical protein
MTKGNLLMLHKLKYSLLITLFLSATSCSFLKREGSWGKKAIYPLSWNNIKRSFIKNATSRHVWVPLSGALIIHSSGLDHKISDWSKKNSPLFEDKKTAAEYSDDLNQILQIEQYATLLLTPSWDSEDHWGEYTTNKLKGATVIYFADGFSHSASTLIKDHVKRTRPDGSDSRSFPSGHATDVAASRQIIAKNLEYSQIDNGVKNTLSYLNGGITTFAIWSRIKADAHFASDALSGYALGSFVSGFIYDSFMNLHPDETFSLFPTKDGGMMTQYSLRY